MCKKRLDLFIIGPNKAQPVRNNTTLFPLVIRRASLRPAGYCLSSSSPTLSPPRTETNRLSLSLVSYSTMVSQRQRLARKRYKEAHPEQFPKPEPTPPKDPNKKKKKKSLFKKKKPTSSTDRRGSSSTRHPLRVPGMKPGEGCYICKSKTHIAKLCPEKSEWERNKVLLPSFLSSLGLKR